MGIAEELKKEGYTLEYEHDEGGDHAEVWTNRERRMAVKVVWMQIEGDHLREPARRQGGDAV